MLEFPKKDSTEEEITAATIVVTKIFSELTAILGKMCAESLRLHQDPKAERDDVLAFDAGLETLRLVIRQTVMPMLETLQKAKAK